MTKESLVIININDGMFTLKGWFVAFAYPGISSFLDCKGLQQDKFEPPCRYGVSDSASLSKYYKPFQRYVIVT